MAFAFERDLKTVAVTCVIRCVLFVFSQDQPGLAILRYEGAAEVLPTSSHTECTDLDPCELVNCPFE